MRRADNRLPATPAGQMPDDAAPLLECRAFPRRSCMLPITCQPVAARDEADPVWSGQVKDLSQGGAGLLLNRRFERGTALAIEIRDADLPTETYLVRVVHVRAGSPGQWLHGCQFISNLSDDELGRLIQPEMGNPAASETVEASRANSRDATPLEVGVKLTDAIELGALLHFDMIGDDAIAALVQAHTTGDGRGADETWIFTE